MAVPRRNAMSCATPLLSGLSNGSIACYGLWDFGDAFGNDVNMCATTGQTAYSYSALGCRVATSACQSGSAVATEMLNTYKPWDSATDNVPLASDAQIAAIAGNLNSTESLVRSQLIRVWIYTCAPAAVAAPVPGSTVSKHRLRMCAIQDTNSLGLVTRFVGRDECLRGCARAFLNYGNQSIALSCQYRDEFGNHEALLGKNLSSLAGVANPTIMVTYQGMWQLDYTRNVAFVRLHVSLSQIATSDVIVPYSTLPKTGMAGRNYVHVSGQVVIPRGSKSANIYVETSVVRRGEIFSVQLGQPNIGTVSSILNKANVAW
jgi:hypothetical protein